MNCLDSRGNDACLRATHRQGRLDEIVIPAVGIQKSMIELIELFIDKAVYA